jgi:hypothetical protein
MSDELYSFTDSPGGHERVTLQVVDRRYAWCPACGVLVRLRREDVCEHDRDANELLAALDAANPAKEGT